MAEDGEEAAEGEDGGHEEEGVLVEDGEEEGGDEDGEEDGQARAELAVEPAADDEFFGEGCPDGEEGEEEDEAPTVCAGGEVEHAGVLLRWCVGEQLDEVSGEDGDEEGEDEEGEGGEPAEDAGEDFADDAAGRGEAEDLTGVGEGDAAECGVDEDECGEEPGEDDGEGVGGFGRKDVGGGGDDEAHGEEAGDEEGGDFDGEAAAGEWWEEVLGGAPSRFVDGDEAVDEQAQAQEEGGDEADDEDDGEREDGEDARGGGDAGGCEGWVGVAEGCVGEEAVALAEVFDGVGFERVGEWRGGVGVGLKGIDLGGEEEVGLQAFVGLGAGLVGQAGDGLGEVGRAGEGIDDGVGEIEAGGGDGVFAGGLAEVGHRFARFDGVGGDVLQGEAQGEGLLIGAGRVDGGLCWCGCGGGGGVRGEEVLELVLHGDGQRADDEDDPGEEGGAVAAGVGLADGWIGLLDRQARQARGERREGVGALVVGVHEAGSGRRGWVARTLGAGWSRCLDMCRSVVAGRGLKRCGFSSDDGGGVGVGTIGDHGEDCAR